MLYGVTELLIVLAIIAVLFGAGKLPEVMQAFGHGLKRFRDASDEDDGTDAEPKAD